MQLGNRYSQHSAAQVPSVKMARSQFDRSFTVKDTFDFDYLVPIFIDEILPGDTCNVTANVFARLATQLKPIMDNLYIDFFFFYVPNRLVWTNWERFNGAQDNPGDSTSFVVPQVVSPVSTGWTNNSIGDKFGLPTGITNLSVNALPFRAYNLIWNQWFRDQNLQNSINVSLGDGPDTVTDYVLRKRGKRHDYFTSSLPAPQKGTAVTMPIGGLATVHSDNYIPASTINVPGGGQTGAYVPTGSTHDYTWGASGANKGIWADLSSATAPTINSLRQAFALQSLLELDARGGTRYVEILLAHFRVQSPDFRLQRAEFLGGGEVRIAAHPVAQTSPTSGGNALAQLGSFATASSAGKSIGFTKSFVEHGYVIGMACARADITYQQGTNRMWSRSTRYDFFWPKLQEIGEQAVLNQEIYTQGNGTDTAVFGYQERYAEYRYKPSEIHGEFRSSYSTPLDMYHMSEQFGSLPTLSSTFITQNTPIARAIAVNTEPHLLFDAWFSYKHARPMVTYAVPATFGRF